MILNYLDTFYFELKGKSEVYLFALIKKNRFLLKSVWSYKVIDILEKIVDSRTLNNKIEFGIILEQIESNQNEKIDQLKLKLKGI